MEKIITRFSGNPILTKKDVPYPVATVHNAAVVKYQNEYIMVFRSHRLNGRSILGLARSNDGYHFKVSSEPFMTPSDIYDEYGVEDPRITRIDENYLINYSAYSRYGVRVGLARTKNFMDVERLAYVSQPDMRNVVLFPEKIGKYYVRLDRPHTELTGWSIWISYSQDLVSWGQSKIVLKPQTYHWDSMKVGPGAPPIKTPKGWLNIFHGVYETMSGAVYRLGVALHDLDDPSKIIGVGDRWILEPEDPWERVGYVPNVVFCCGAIPEENGTLKIYWGAADTVMCVGTANINELVEYCLQEPRDPL
ncbi:MAG: glycoside hydrolase family 130 protein [Candidatus Bathyarchaeota archaeon]|nr:glycoside hydrolase family 130 protein [Candidatus Bathyarchaeota archaeon]